MAYLDEDILYNNVEEKYKSAKGKAREAYSDVLDTICEMPRADVVPKSEVEKIFEEVEKAVEDAEFEWGTFYGVKLAIAELKKKYTEGTQ